jgi:uncharacterized protein YkwD
MIRLNLLSNLSWRRMRRPYRLLLIAAVLAVLAGVVSIAALAHGSHTSVRVGQPALLLTDRAVPSSSGPGLSRPRSSAAVVATPPKSAARRGLALSMAVTGPDHTNQISSEPSTAIPVHRVQTSFNSAPSRWSTASRQTPAPQPSPHVIGDGGLVSSVNGFRSQNGASSLGYSSGLTGDAENCALQMARNTLVAHCGGNQVVAGAWSGGGCMSLFESEQAHREVLLSPAFSTAGSGIAVDAAGAYYCVVNFA